MEAAAWSGGGEEEEDVVEILRWPLAAVMTSSTSRSSGEESTSVRAGGGGVEDAAAKEAAVATASKTASSFNEAIFVGFEAFRRFLDEEAASEDGVAATYADAVAADSSGEEDPSLSRCVANMDIVVVVADRWCEFSDGGVMEAG